RGRRFAVRTQSRARHHAGARHARCGAGRTLRGNRAFGRRPLATGGDRVKTLAFSWRTLRREFRYGELATLAIALVFAVAALGAVATLGRRVEHSVLASATELIGGDIGLNSRQPLPPQIAAQAAQLGLRTSASADFPSVLF